MVTMNSARNNSFQRTGTLSNGNTVLTQAPGQAGSQAMYLMTISISGADVAQRFLYTINHQGLGGAGAAILLATYLNIDTSGNYTLNSITTNSSGEVVLNATITSGTFTYFVRLTPIGYDFNLNNA